MIGGVAVEVVGLADERSRRRDAPLVKSFAIFSLQSDCRSLRPWEMNVCGSIRIEGIAFGGGGSRCEGRLTKPGGGRDSGVMGGANDMLYCMRGASLGRVLACSFQFAEFKMSRTW